MKLFLSGGGSGIQSFELDKKFLESIDLSKPVLYIPIAIDTNEHSYPDCLVWIKANFAQFGFSNFVMWTETDLTGKKDKDFEQFGGVYIGGGNTFKLLKELKDFGTFEIINKLALNNIPIYGGSAGVIIFARTIIPAMTADENNVGLEDFSALNLLNGFDAWCHYESSVDVEIEKFMKKQNIEKIIAIPEDAGLFVSEKGIETVGPNSITVFGSDKNIFQPNKIIL